MKKNQTQGVNPNFERMPRRVKKQIIADSDSPRIFKLVLASRIPRLRYHGIDPASLGAVDLDIYLATGEQVPAGQVFKYFKTRLG